ncbi:ester cyclase [Rhodospirillaceae bacterium AH-315-P19]|nr:ester cyclase [Rhodospirillaceae bacterium AH-315-P19]
MIKRRVLSLVGPSLFRPVLAVFFAALLLSTVGANGSALAAGAPISGGPAKAAKTAMESWTIGWNTGNLDSIVEAVGDGFYWTSPLPLEGIRGGALRKHAASLLKAFPNSQFSRGKVKRTDKGVIYWEWTWKATHTGTFAGTAATNKSIQLNGIDVIRVHKDGTVGIKRYWNELALLKAIGAVE